MTATPQRLRPVSNANRLALDYRAEASRFAYTGPIIDVHTHLNSVEAARLYFEAAEVYGVTHAVSMSPLEVVDDLKAAFGERIAFIAVPNYMQRDDPDTFYRDFLRRIEAFAEKGCRMVKFWAAPRGRDFTEHLQLDSPAHREARQLAQRLGMSFMTHVADPDTWFATKYADARKYGTKLDQYPPLERLLEEVAPTSVIGAHMGGFPEDLDFVQRLLDRHPNYVVDTSATKWMVRELSKRPAVLADFCRRNVGRILFGTDIVANEQNRDSAFDEGSGGFDLYASRFWALRTLLETGYDGPSPIVDPDLHMVDPSVEPKSMARLRGCGLQGDVLRSIYHDAAQAILPE